MGKFTPIAGSQDQAANVLGVNTRTFNDIIRREKCPGCSNRRYDLTQIVPWYIERAVAAERAEWQEKFSQLETDESGDPLLSGGDSPALEEYRRAKARLAELDLAHRRGELFLVAEVEANHGKVVDTLRRLCVQTKVRFPPEYLELLNETLEDLERDFENFRKENLPNE